MADLHPTEEARYSSKKEGGSKKKTVFLTNRTLVGDPTKPGLWFFFLCHAFTKPSSMPNNNNDFIK
jgi:hypothetical protein